MEDAGHQGHWPPLRSSAQENSAAAPLAGEFGKHSWTHTLPPRRARSQANCCWGIASHLETVLFVLIMHITPGSGPLKWGWKAIAKQSGQAQCVECHSVSRKAAGPLGDLGWGWGGMGLRGGGCCVSVNWCEALSRGLPICLQLFGRSFWNQAKGIVQPHGKEVSRSMR